MLLPSILPQQLCGGILLFRQTVFQLIGLLSRRQWLDSSFQSIRSEGLEIDFENYVKLLRYLSIFRIFVTLFSIYQTFQMMRSGIILCRIEKINSFRSNEDYGHIIWRGCKDCSQSWFSFVGFTVLWAQGWKRQRRWTFIFHRHWRPYSYGDREQRGLP